MKKLLTLTAVGVILSAPAIAASKCVPKLSASAFPGSFNGGGVTGGHDFQVVYNNTLPDSFALYGIAACSSQVPSTSNFGLTASSLSMNPGNYCWCKFVSPAVSKWFGTATSENSACISTCASTCATYFISNRISYTDTWPNNFWLSY